MEQNLGGVGPGERYRGRVMLRLGHVPRVQVSLWTRGAWSGTPWCTCPSSSGTSPGPTAWTTRRQRSGEADTSRTSLQHPLSSTDINVVCIWRRNTTDVMLHLIQPRFKNIFGEHYYRLLTLPRMGQFHEHNNYIWTEQWSRTCSGRPTRWWCTPTSSWTPTRTTSTTATPSGSHPKVLSGLGSGSSFQPMYMWRGLL